MRRMMALAFLALVGCDAGEKRPVEIKNGVRITYSLAEGSPEAAATMMQKRLDAAKVPGIARAGGGTIVVDLAAGSPEAIWSARELISRTGKLDVKVVDDGSALMRDLAKVIREDVGAQERGIRDEVDHWATATGESHDDVYFTARDRQETMSIDEAKKRGCFRDPDVPGSSRCLVSGREQLATYVVDTALLHNIQIPEDHALAYERIAPRSEAAAIPYWRTYYVKKASPLGADAIASAAATVDRQTGAPVIEVKLRDDATKAFAELTRTSIGKKLAVIVDDRVKSAPIIMSKIDGGRLFIMLDATESVADAKVLASAIASPLPGPVREETAFELKDGKVIAPPAE